MAENKSAVVQNQQLLSEIEGGEGLSLSAAGRLFPGHRGGEAVAPSSVFRWVVTGTRTPNGGVVRLEAVRVGGRWLTSRGAVARFVAALTAASSPAHPGTDPPVRTRAQRLRAADRAAEELKRRGA